MVQNNLISPAPNILIAKNKNNNINGTIIPKNESLIPAIPPVNSDIASPKISATNKYLFFIYSFIFF